MSRLGNILVRHGLLKESDRRMIRRESGGHRGSFARSVLALGVAEEGELASLIVSETKFKQAPQDLGAAIQADALGSVPAAILQWLEVIPVTSRRGALVVAMVDPTDREVISQLEFFSGQRIIPVVASLSSIRFALSQNLLTSMDFGKSDFEEFLEHYTGRALKFNSKKTKEIKPEDSDSETLEWSSVSDESTSYSKSSDGGEPEGAFEPLTESSSDDDGVSLDSQTSDSDSLAGQANAEAVEVADVEASMMEAAHQDDREDDHQIGVDELPNIDSDKSHLESLHDDSPAADSTPNFDETEDEPVGVGLQGDGDELAGLSDEVAEPSTSDEALFAADDPSSDVSLDSFEDADGEQKIDALESAKGDSQGSSEPEDDLFSNDISEKQTPAVQYHAGIAILNRASLKISMDPDFEAAFSHFSAAAANTGVSLGCVVKVKDGSPYDVRVWGAKVGEDVLVTTAMGGACFSQPLERILESAHWPALDKILTPEAFGQMRKISDETGNKMTHGFVKKAPYGFLLCIGSFVEQSDHEGLRSSLGSLMGALATKG
jgi:hypothetical protein